MCGLSMPPALTPTVTHQCKVKLCVKNVIINLSPLGIGERVVVVVVARADVAVVVVVSSSFLLKCLTHTRPHTHIHRRVQ